MRTRVIGAVTLLSVLACGGEADTTGAGGSGGLITGVSTTTGVGGAPSSSSPATTSSAAAGGMGTGGDAAGGQGGGQGGAQGGGGGGPACPDASQTEPNDSLGTAWKISEEKLDDCDTDSDPETVAGVIVGANDVDWYWYEGDDGVGPCVDPGRSLTQSESGIRICKFLQCKVGDAEFDCPSGTTTAQEDGVDGCCGTSDFDLADLNCTGTLDDAANVFIRLDQPGAGASTCNAYTLSVDF